MKITTDTNLLVRLFVEDHRAQTDAARRILEEAEVAVIPTPALCELVWVLRAVYGQSRQVAMEAIEKLSRTRNAVVDVQVVETGLAMMRAGGDFADGAIAAEGRIRGGDAFASFDRAAVKRLTQLGIESKLVDVRPADAG